MTYSDQEKDRIIRDYFGLAGKDENPRCPSCGEVLVLQAEYRTHFHIHVSCPDCGARFTWEQCHLVQPWKSLHLEYFLECYRLGDVLRCPVDDCYVNYVEFSDRIIEFRCPYCNRRGKARLASLVEQKSKRAKEQKTES